MATQEIDFWFDFASTYSYLSAARVEAACAEAGLAVRFRPFLLGPIFAAQGWNDSPFNLYPAKGRYMWRDLARIAAGRGLPFRRPSQFPRRSSLAARAAWAAPEHARAAFCRAVFTANFADDRDVGDAQVLDALAQDLGLPGLVAEAEGATARKRLRAATEEAMARGLFGAPSFTVGEELFWGDDRLEQAIAWAQR